MKPASHTQPFLQIVDVHKHFTGVYALRGVSLQFERGQIYHLLGENGCGKSTLIKIIAGAQPPDQGHLLIDGRHYDRLSALQALSAGIETVYQDLSLLPNMSVAENIGLTAELAAHHGRLARTFDRRGLAATAAIALREVGLPTDAAFQATLVEQLPLATRQLIAIARGGLIPAALLARELDVRMVESIAVATYEGKQAGQPRLLKPAAVNDQGEGWVIVDDLVDRGHTARFVRGLLPRARFVCLYAKPEGRPLADKVVGDYPQDVWLKFPWEREL